MKLHVNFLHAPLAILLGQLLVHSHLEAADPARFARVIDTWGAQDDKAPPAPGGVLFIGSSSIRMWKTLPTDFPGFPTINRGFGGSWTQDVLHYYDRIVRPYKPSKIVFYCGENDIAGGEASCVPVENFKKFVEWARADNPCVEIYYIPMKPSPNRWRLWPEYQRGNGQIRQFCKERKIHYLHTIPQKMITREGRPDAGIFLKDMLHMNDKGYKIWATEVRKAMGLAPNG